MNCTIYTDGGSLNNPGQAAFAYVIYFDDKIHDQYSEAMGVATNNIAEYTGLLKAFEKIKEYKKTEKIERIYVFADSELMVRQLNGIYKVKNADILDLFMKIRILESQIQVPIKYTHVLREKNRLADSLVKKALGR